MHARHSLFASDVVVCERQHIELESTLPQMRCSAHMAEAVCSIEGYMTQVVELCLPNRNENTHCT